MNIKYSRVIGYICTVTFHQDENYDNPGFKKWNVELSVKFINNIRTNFYENQRDTRTLNVYKYAHRIDKTFPLLLPSGSPKQISFTINDSDSNKYSGMTVLNNWKWRSKVINFRMYKQGDRCLKPKPRPVAWRHRKIRVYFLLNKVLTTLCDIHTGI